MIRVIKFRTYIVDEIPATLLTNTLYYRILPGGEVKEYMTDWTGTLYEITNGVGGGSGTYEEVTESLIGTIDNSNATFTTTFNFVPDSELVFINGLKQTKPTHYNTLGTNTIVFSDSPRIGESLEINYEKI